MAAMLQTEDYARAVIGAGRPRDSAAAVDRTVSARLERQAILEIRSEIADV